jgi:hypothetical protein
MDSYSICVEATGQAWHILNWEETGAGYIATMAGQLGVTFMTTADAGRAQVWNNGNVITHVTIPGSIVEGQELQVSFLTPAQTDSYSIRIEATGEAWYVDNWEETGAVFNATMADQEGFAAVTTAGAGRAQVWNNGKPVASVMLPATSFERQRIQVIFGIAI